MGLGPSSSNTIDITISNNEMNANQGANAVELDYGGSSTQNNIFTVTSNTIANSSQDGIFVGLSNSGGALTTNITDNVLSSNSLNGIEIQFQSSSTVLFPTTISGNTAFDNAEAGIYILDGNSSSSSVVSVLAENNTLFNNNALGLAPVAPNNQGFSAIMNAGNSNAVLCLELINNSSDTGYALQQLNGRFNLAPDPAQPLNSGTIYPSGAISAVGSCP
jgi:hypothetical protein